MSSDICQHNLEKAQRKLLKREGMVGKYLYFEVAQRLDGAIGQDI